MRPPQPEPSPGLTPYSGFSRPVRRDSFPAAQPHGDFYKEPLSPQHTQGTTLKGTGQAFGTNSAIPSACGHTPEVLHHLPHQGLKNTQSFQTPGGCLPGIQEISVQATATGLDMY